MVKGSSYMYPCFAPTLSVHGQAVVRSILSDALVSLLTQLLPTAVLDGPLHLSALPSSAFFCHSQLPRTTNIAALFPSTLNSV